MVLSLVMFSISVLPSQNLHFAAGRTPRVQPDALQQEVHHLDAIVRQAQAARERIESAPARLVFCSGGDCGVEVLPVSFANREWPGLALVWFDAHADLNSPESSPLR